jgi:Zn-dependent peptidase ImmA (M78 family)
LAIPENCTHKEKENKCHHFAGALLLPMEVVKTEFGKNRRPITINELMVMQRRYGLSIKAIVYRLRNADILSENSLKKFYISLNKDKALKEEVDKSRFNSEEHSERFERLVYRAMAQESISTSKASAYLQQSVQEVRNNFALV